MVVALGPGRFYGSSLPRPRIYTDVKFSSERVDPPVPVTDPLISWAQEAHWSMGGLSFHRHRLQGRIEGNINRLRSQKESALRKKTKTETKTTRTPSPPPAAPVAVKRKMKKKARTPSPLPAAPVAVKRKRRIIDEEEEEEVEVTRRTVRKLKDEFDLVATTVDDDAAQNKPEKEKEGVVQLQTQNRGGLIGKRLIKGSKGIKKAPTRLIRSIFA